MRKPETIGLIGAGAMGAALARGLLAAKRVKPGNLVVCDSDAKKSSALARELGVASVASNREVVAGAAVVILAVKPAVIEPVVDEIAPLLKKNQTLVSVAAGVRLSRILPYIDGKGVNLARVMPNTPALVGAGMAGLAFDAAVDVKSRARVRQIFEAVGEVVEVDESLMDAVTGLSGSGPAYVFLLIEALADGGVAAGLGRPVAAQLALQTVYGAAALLKETGNHPAEAKDMVASPGGTTIAGLSVLERGAFRSSIIEAVLRATERSRELSNQ